MNNEMRLHSLAYDSSQTRGLFLPIDQLTTGIVQKCIWSCQLMPSFFFGQPTVHIDYWQMMEQSNLDGVSGPPIAGWRGDNLPHAGLRLRLQGQVLAK